MCRRRATAVSLISTMFFLMTGLSSLAQTLIITVDGREHVGEVIDAGVNTLKMKLEGSGYQIVPLQSISRIKVDIADGEPIEGKYHDWSDGEIIVRVGDRDVAVRDGTITSVTDVGIAVGGPELSPSEPASEEWQSPSEQPATPDVKHAPGNATM
ncbi:MAG: hypothetical protein ACR2Q4_02025 [Geminicoccaceae bacterium]